MQVTLAVSLLRCAGTLSRPLLACVLGVASLASSAAGAPAGDPKPAPARSVDEWLARMHAAPRQHSFVGTFVVSSPEGALSSGRIWHASDGRRQVEKVESLTGATRSTLRRGDQFLTLMPEQRLARLEQRQSFGLFPSESPRPREASLAARYTAREAGADRVAGFEADLVLIEPRDSHRYGYRVWSEKKSGLVVKLQTVDAQGQVLEQAVFSQLQIDAPLRAREVVPSLEPPAGWRVERIANAATTAQSEGWDLRPPVPGFEALGCYRRGPQTAQTLQCVYSDGLASVSLFVEPYDPQRHGTGQSPVAVGASQAQARRLKSWWLTTVGEVPPQTLRAFAQALERRQ